VGEADYTKTMMKKLGDVAFWRIAMRPGRPMAVGRILNAKSASSPGKSCAGSYQNNSNPNGGSRFAAGPPQGETATSGGSEPHEVGSVGAILFGLPGNPVAVMVTFLAFVRPALLQMMGATAPAPPLLKACSTEPIRKKPGRTEYQRGWVSTAADGSLQVKTTGSQGSGVLRSMAEANGLIVLHHLQGNVAVGDHVDVLMFDGAV
jgi:molybdopterin molybdotransferase